MIVVFAERAFADLNRIGEFIALDNPRRSSSFVDELIDRCYRLADMPNAYPLLVGHEHTGIRRRPYGQYLIFYRIEKETLLILHVLNSAQDHEAILFRPTQ